MSEHKQTRGRRGVVLLFLLSFPTFLGLVSFTALASPSASLKILSHTGYQDSIRFYHVVGEVQNLGSVDVYQVRITASFYDSHNTFIANSTAQTAINIVLAGRRAPFDIILLNLQQSAAVHRYTFHPTFTPYPDVFPLGLELVSSSSYGQFPEWMHVTGVIRNNASTPALSGKVVATFYNSTRGVVATAFAASNPIDIDPGQQATFDVALTPDRVPYVSSYFLSAESEGYGLISKPPLNTVLTLVAPETILADRTALTATLRDENRVPIALAEVKFDVYLNSAWRDIGSSTTNGTGQSEITYLPESAGEFQVKATYNGSTDIYLPSSEVTVLRVVSPPLDTEPPIWPAGSTLTASNVGFTTLVLTWTAATDNFEIVSYRIFQRNALLASLQGDSLTYNVTTLEPGRTYTFKIEAGDAENNWSNNGPSVTVSTRQPSAGPPPATVPNRPNLLQLNWLWVIVGVGAVVLASVLTRTMVQRKAPNTK